MKERLGIALWLVTKLILLALLTSSITCAQSPALERAMQRFAGIYRKAPIVTKGLEIQNPKIDSSLQELTTGEAHVELIATDEADVPRLTDAVRTAGGEVTTTFENYIFAVIPVSAIPTLAASDSLFFMSRQPAAAPQQEIISKAPTLIDAIGAGRLQSSGITGRGVKIGIIDFGFARYQKLESTGGLPHPGGIRVFGTPGRESQEYHGTACAEIIHRMAPDAELYLAAAADSDAGSIIAAAQWLVAQRVKIISFSGGMFEGPHNGGSLLDRFVDGVVNQGILWVNSSGNGALNHWMGSTRNHDKDGWLLFSSKSAQLLFFKASAKDISIDVVWDDWGKDPRHPASTAALQAFLFGEGHSADPELLAARRFDPSGHAAPTAHFEQHGVEKDAIFALSLNVRAPEVRDIKVHVFTRGFSEQFPVVADGSVNIPATSRNVLSVGAVNIRNGEIEPFSSRGPTDDGRPKPELVAYDNMALSVFPNGFEGTSAACPHAAGLAALVLQMHPELAGLTLRQAMLKYVRPPRGGIAGAGYGLGILDVAHMPLPEQSGPSVSLPASFGGTISFTALDELRTRASEFRAFETKIALVRQPTVYHYGEGLKLTYHSLVRAYYLILDRDSHGSYSLVLPQSTEDPQQLEAARNYVYPESGADLLRVTPPGGREEVLLLCAPEPVKLEQGWDRLKGKLSVSIASYEVLP